MITCQHCGKQIPYDANLCPYCGLSIKQFQQKEVLEEKDVAAPEKEEEKDEPIQTPKSPRPSGDKKLLFYIIALLVLLLILGGIYHYSSMKSYVEDEEQAPDTTKVKVPEEEVKNDGKVVYDAKKSQRVVVNGEGVRLRFGPSLKANYLKDEKGATKSVKKGTQLECVGEDGDWYQVVYQGKKYYMSKQFTYLVE
ncbi:MAG: hypothetical protein J5548_03160 [Prevotella sp.]|nr:hypothetical protein [Prevotella sp.]